MKRTYICIVASIFTYLGTQNVVASEIKSKLELMQSVSESIPDVYNIVSSSRKVVAMCNLYKQKFGENRDLYDHLIDTKNNSSYIDYIQCCPTKMALLGAKIGNKLLGVADEFQLAPSEESVVMETAVDLLNKIYSEKVNNDIVERVDQEIKMADKTIDRAACAPLATAYELSLKEHRRD